MSQTQTPSSAVEPVGSHDAPVEADPAVPPAGSADDDAPRRRRAFSRWQVTVSAVLTALLVGLVVGLVLLLQSWQQKQALTDARGEALAGARQAVVDFIGLDYRHLDQEFATVESIATGAFKSDFDKTKSGLASDLKKQKTISQATIRGAAVSFATPTEASVLVAVDNHVTSSQGDKTSRYRLQVHMVRVDSTWKVEDVKPL